ncbi:MAG: hypothetical protein DRG78_00770 [Epsilonproteobacteria bacterium]|nr:MAG: hypothetical protein DRG78_00770 [Campylobacterota bacterium]
MTDTQDKTHFDYDNGKFIVVIGDVKIILDREEVIKLNEDLTTVLAENPALFEVKDIEKVSA